MKQQIIQTDLPDDHDMIAAAPVTLIVLAIAMGILSFAIILKQATAKSCPIHNRTAGRIATILAGLLLVGSATLMFFAWTLSFSGRH